MQFEKAFSYQFEDPQWPAKLGLGALISLVPILNFALVGYMVAIMRNVVAQAAEPLPHWDDLGRKFMDGLLVTLAGFIYAIPMLALLAVPAVLLLAARVSSSNSGLQDFSSALGALGGLVLAPVIFLLFLYALLLSIIRPAILVLFSRDGTFSSCFRLGEMIQLIRRNARLFFLTWLIVILASMAVGFVVSLAGTLISWIPCIGWLAAIVLGLGSAIYLVSVDAYLFGQFRAAAIGPSAVALPAVQAESKQNPGDLSS